jgi:hypothetical protein
MVVDYKTASSSSNVLQETVKKLNIQKNYKPPISNNVAVRVFSIQQKPKKRQENASVSREFIEYFSMMHSVYIRHCASGESVMYENALTDLFQLWEK